MVRKREVHQSKGMPGRSHPLRKIPCLATLDGALFNQLQEHAREEQYRRGEILFQEGAVCDEIFVILKGSVKVSRVSDEGRQQTLWILGNGDCFCQAPFFHQARYPGTAQCLTDVKVIALRQAHGISPAREVPQLAAAIIRCLCQREAAMASLLETASARQVRRRLVRILLDLARSRGVANEDGILLGGLTHDELAACVGTAREVISRTLGELQRAGLVRLGRRRLVLLDLAGLQGILSPPSSRQKKIVFGDCSH